MHIRTAQPNDTAALCILADSASRGVISYAWGMVKEPGQSVFEVGYQAIRDSDESLLNLQHWRVAEANGEVVGAINSYIQPLVPNPEHAPRVLRPLQRLKQQAQGCWYIAVVAVFEHAQGQGIGTALLANAEQQAREAGAQALALMVLSTNPEAQALYERLGFEHWATQPFESFAGSDESGEWRLMRKQLAHD